jgi:DNA-directed RNA polymerase specialized sigma24 family protein
MAEHLTHQVTQLLDAVGQGDTGARDRLWELIYQELRHLAISQLAHEAPGRALQPTTLVHEVYLRLTGPGNGHFLNRRHFFGAAAKAMRRIRIDDARRRGRIKRGGPGIGNADPGCAQDQVRTGAARLGRHDSISGLAENSLAFFDGDPIETLALDEALARLEHENPRGAEVVELRFFAGLTVDQTAEIMELAPRTVELEWRATRAWLYGQLSGGEILS